MPCRSAARARCRMGRRAYGRRGSVDGGRDMTAPAGKREPDDSMNFILWQGRHAGTQGDRLIERDMFSRRVRGVVDREPHRAAFYDRAVVPRSRPGSGGSASGGKVVYPLPEILLTVLCGKRAGAGNFVEAERRAKRKAEVLRRRRRAASRNGWRGYDRIRKPMYRGLARPCPMQMFRSGQASGSSKSHSATSLGNISAKASL